MVITILFKLDTITWSFNRTSISHTNLHADGFDINNINSSGIVTTTVISGYDYLKSRHTGTTVTFTVTVSNKTSNHRYADSGSTSAYYIDGIESPFLTLTPGRTYRFNLSSNNQSSHPFRFYLEADKTTEYTTNVNTASTYTEITVTDETPTVLHYQCDSHEYMGNAVQVNSNKIHTPYASTFDGDVNLGDDNRLRLGDGNDLQIFHNGSGSFIQQTGVGNFFITSNTDDGDIVISTDDGSGGTANYFRADGSTGESILYHYGSGKLSTKSNGIDVTGHTETDTLNVSGISTFSGNIIASSTLTVGDATSISGGAPTDQGVLSVYTSGGKNALIIQTDDNDQHRGIAFRNSGDAYIGYISIEDAGSNLGDMVFGVSGSTQTNVNNVNERLRITSDGSVGIGTDNPAVKLDVRGTTNIHNELKVVLDSTNNSSKNVARIIPLGFSGITGAQN